MKILKKYGCLSKAQIQTLIDNELDKKTFAKYSAHIEKCPYCQQRVNAKKKEIEKVADSMRVLESYSVPNNLNKNPHFIKGSFLRPAAWIGVAASILVAVAIFIHTQQLRKTDENKCNWVALSSKELHVELESPNRLFRMRTIECKEMTRDSSLKVTYLVKTCKR